MLLKKLYLICCSLFVFQASISSNSNWNFSLSTDSTPYLFNGVSIITFIENKEHLKNYRIGLEYFHMDMPSFYTNLHPNNKDKNWSQKVNSGYILYLDYFLDSIPEDKNRFHIGAGASILNSTFTRSTSSQKKDINITEGLLRFGYQWFPFKDTNLFINPFASLLYLIPEKEPTINDETYTIAPIQFLSTLHVGFKF